MIDVAMEVMQRVMEWIQDERLLVTVCAAVAALLLFFQQHYYYIRARRMNLPPGPRGWPIVGNLLQLGSNPSRAMTALHKKYGHILYLRLGSIPTVVVNSPELAAEILKVQENVFSLRPRMSFTRIVAYEGYGIAMAQYGAHWRYIRRICVHELLTPKRLESTAHLRSEEISYMIAEVAAAARAGNEALSVRALLASVSMAVMCRMMLGRRKLSVRTEGQKKQESNYLVTECFRLMGAFNLGDFVPWLGWLDLGGVERDMRKLRRDLDETLDSIIQEHRDLASGKLPGGNPNDFISALLELPGEDGSSHMDPKSIKCIILDMLVGGTDTSAVTNEWAMAEIIRHPEVQRKLQSELDAVVGRDRNVVESDLPNLPYLMCIIKETLRVRPIGAFSIPRESASDTTVNGFFIPKGTRVLVHFTSYNHAAGSWTDPLSFRPERWSNENLTTISDPALRIMTFGIGRRQCPGYNLGSTMVLYVLARLFHGFDWALPQGVTADTVDMEEDYGFTIPMRTRLRAVPTPRLAPHLYAQ